ncbi:MAG: anti-sigma factor family protein [Planctomycetota bacterium]|jgi:anti-sigma factor RsiW
MNCQDTRQRLDACYDGELGEAESRAVAKHLSDCPDCSRALADLQALGGFLRTHGRGGAQPELLNRMRQDLLARADSGSCPGSKQNPWASWLPRLAAAGLGALVVGIGWQASTDHRAPTPPPPQPMIAYFHPKGLPDGTPDNQMAMFVKDMQRLRTMPENKVLAWARERRNGR